ncbi:uncharacterized protein LOC110844918 isoform X2 [Folsomia candida]|uniref:uncharacterized protein LOC110844918 isoform X2 n=1 Tax=Folsomia candida TaxID=158441 RepID=UPI00160551D1|nr:uncharacterized protein LOC110844918 isoform X2 [Folsomia candida]
MYSAEYSPEVKTDEEQEPKSPSDCQGCISNEEESQEDPSFDLVSQGEYFAMDGQGDEGTLQESQTQTHHQHHSYNNHHHPQYVQGQGDYQYLPGQHWLAGPSVITHGSPEQNTYSNNVLSVGAFGNQLPQFSGYNQNGGGTVLGGGCSTIHHTGPQQQQQISTMTTGGGGGGIGSICPLPALPMAYSMPTHGSSSSNNTRNSINSIMQGIVGQQSSMTYLNSCTNYSHTHHHGNGPSSSSAFSSHVCHHHGGQFGGTTSTSSSVTSHSTSTAGGTVSNAPASRMPWSTSSEILAYPGGLEVVWREVPETCQRLITMQDVPDTARMRGYFTVCELLSLKRNLMGRLEIVEAERSQITPREESVGVAVKEAMNTLDDTPQSQDSPLAEDVRKTRVKKSKDPEPSKEDEVPKETLPSSSPSPSSQPLEIATVITTATTVQTNCSTASKSAYRTATLVFKLLQIGNNQIRSFSEMNPNRLRVLFNTQRITYECHLTLVKARDSIHGSVRKLLTVDIGFDQITMLRFGCNKLFLKVDGSPLLSVSYYPAEMDTTCPPMTEQDHLLLDQIDKGQLKLSPCHQIYFINERLVHLLEAQFKQHPRFRNIIQQLPEPVPC